MAESATGSAKSSGVASIGQPVQNMGNAYTLRFSALAALTDRALAFGSAAAPPATLGALHGATQAELMESGIRYTVAAHPGGGWDVTVTGNLGACDAMTAYENVYACLFAINPAVSSSVPDLIVDLGVLTTA